MLSVNRVFLKKSYPASIESLQKILLRLSFFNLFIVALIGLLLRSNAFIPLPFSFKNLLHGHSHFAFGGWVMPLLIWLIMSYFPELTEKISIKDWRNIVFMVFISAYGMLLSFPVQGYGVISNIFSTLSILAGFYLAKLIWQASGQTKKNVSYKFLSAGLFYMVLSSLGPFATGPLVAFGQAGTPLYQNVIYFFLHFQYNGWFSFTILAILIKIIEEKNGANNANKVFILFNLSCIPGYFLSILWDHPSQVFYFIGGMAGILQLTGVYFLVKDYRMIRIEQPFVRNIIVLALTAIVLKTVLQLASAFPFFADLAFLNRNFIIAYLHLVLVGFISLSGLAFILKSDPGLVTSNMKAGIIIFIFSFITTELLLLDQTINLFHLSFYYHLVLLFSFSCLFPLSTLVMAVEVNKHFISGKFSLQNQIESAY